MSGWAFPRRSGNLWPGVGAQYDSELVYQLHEMGTDHIRVFPVHRAFQVRVNHALGCYLCFYIVVYQLGIVLGAHA